MRFAFTDDQLAFRDAVRDLLAKECPPEVVRAAWPDGADAHGARPGEGARADADRVDAVWAALADMGVLGVAVPEAHGGLGLTELDWVLLAEETGYAALPHPFVETVLRRRAAAGRRRRPRGPAGRAGHGDRDRSACSPLAAPLVPWGDRVRTARARRTGARRPAVVAWPGGSTDAGRRRRSTAASPHLCRRVDRVAASSSSGVAADGALGDEVAAEAAFDRGALGTAAQLVGLGRRMLDLTVGYVAERKQFGVPIGSFQAVKHHLADAALELAFAAPAVHRAAWSLATARRPRSRDVSMAKALASDAARARRPPGPPVPRRHRLHGRVRPPPVPQAGRGARPRLGRRRLAPPPGRHRARHLSAVPTRSSDPRPLRPATIRVANSTARARR